MAEAPPLRDYQKVALGHLRRHPRAGLFMDMGLGKTCVVLKSLDEDRLPALVTAPKRVAENVWDEEVELWRPDLTVAIAAGTPAKRKEALESGADVVVIGRDNLEDALPYVPRFRTFVIDELSGFKTRGTDRWKAARKASVRIRYVKKEGRKKREIKVDLTMPYVIGMTGSPTPKSLLDLWAQLFLLDGGERLGRTLSGFRARYFLPGRQLANGTITEWYPREEADRAIHRKVDDICLAMETEGRVDLPPFTYNVVKVPLDPKVKAIYKAMKEKKVADLGLLGEVHTADSAATVSSKLSQISAGFMYVDDADLREGAYDVIHWNKARAVAEIVEGTGSPVIVFYRYVAEAEMIRKTIESALGAGTVEDGSAPNLQKRWNRGEIPVLLVHPASAGHGLNLQKGPGHTMIWSSLPWSLEEWQQANKRLVRPGQTNPVVIHLLMSPRTIDYAIRDRLDEKASVQRALLDHLESPL